LVSAQNNECLPVKVEVIFDASHVP
jgi:hypothetical protein